MNNKLTIEGRLFVRPDVDAYQDSSGDFLWVSHDYPRIELWKKGTVWRVFGPNCSFQGKAGQSLQSVLHTYEKTSRNLETMQRDKATGTFTLAEPLPKNAVAVVTYEHEWRNE